MTTKTNYYIDVNTLLFHPDTFIPYIPTPSEVKKVEQLLASLKKDLDNAQTDCNKAIRLIRNADVIFNTACVNLQRMTIVCLLTALLTIIGGLGVAFYPKEYKKTRFGFICLTVLSAALSIFAAISLSHMHTKVSTFQGFFDRRWS